MKTADPELMRAINRFHVMDAIRRFGPVSRVEICELTELSATTVSAITVVHHSTSAAPLHSSTPRVAKRSPQ